jgi:hypothetical protein
MSSRNRKPPQSEPAIEIAGGASFVPSPRAVSAMARLLRAASLPASEPNLEVTRPRTAAGLVSVMQRRANRSV